MAAEGFNPIYYYLFIQKFLFNMEFEIMRSRALKETENIGNDLLTICVHSEVIHRFREAELYTCPDSKPH